MMIKLNYLSFHRIILLLFAGLSGFVPILPAQNSAVKDFSFSYKWGTYGHFKVSSQIGMLSEKVQHPDIYADTEISFTQSELSQIREKAEEIVFFDYPATYQIQAPKTPSPEPDFEIVQLQSGDSVWTDTVFQVSAETLFMVSETVPHSSYSLKIWMEGKEHTVSWQGGKKLWKENGDQDIEIIDPRYESLMELGNLISSIVRKKEAWKNKPKSDLSYY